MKLDPSTRPKMKAGTYVVADMCGNVYVQNRDRVHRFQGEATAQWLEKLMQVFTGEYTLAELTDGLSHAYRQRIYDIASLLLEEGYAHDASQSRPHHLSKQVQNAFSSQIAFLDNLIGSGEFHFELYRACRVLAIGSGPALPLLTNALLESGVSVVHLADLSSSLDHARLREMERHASVIDPAVQVREIQSNATISDSQTWRKIIHSYDVIFYAPQSMDVEALLELHFVCKEASKRLAPVVLQGGIGIAGPIVHPQSDTMDESAWRRIYAEGIREASEGESIPTTAVALLTNAIVFEVFLAVAGVATASLHQFYRLELDTLQGAWQRVL